MRTEKKTGRKIFGCLLGGILGLVLVLVVSISISNARLFAQHQEPQAVLQASELAEAAEFQHLRRTLGDDVWPGWGSADIPVVYYNAAYAFLTGIQNPEDGWIKLPQMTAQGSAWEELGSSNEGVGMVHRQALVNDVTPQAFTVRVGQQYAASLTTLTWMKEKLVQDIRADFPAFADYVFPFRFFRNQLINSREHFVAMVAHESFHAYQGTMAEERLLAAEQANPLEESYPWDVVQEDWKAEVLILADAMACASTAECESLASEFLAARDARRLKHSMSSADIEFEQMLEWEEGLAKYIELMIWKAASESETYQPSAEIGTLADFHQYQNFNQQWRREVRQIGMSANQASVTRFYYSGMAQAVLLDQLLPGWQDLIWQDGVYLEDLLRQALAD